MEENRTSVPPGWKVRSSKNHPGHVYYVNVKTGRRTWDLSETKKDSNPAKVLKVASSTGSSNDSPSWSVSNCSRGFFENSTPAMSTALSRLSNPETNSNSSSTSVNTEHIESKTSQAKTRRWKSSSKSTPAEAVSGKRKIKLSRHAFEIQIKTEPVDEPPQESESQVPTAQDALSQSILRAQTVNSWSGTDVEASSRSSRCSTVSQNSSYEGRLLIDVSSPEPQEKPVDPVLNEPSFESLAMDECPMEIDNDEVDEEAMMVDIQEVREDLKSTPRLVCGELTACVNEYASFPDVNNEKEKMMCIVIDTNVLIGYIKTITHIQQMLTEQNCSFIFLIPWVVLQELDALKSRESSTNCSVGKQARTAVKFLYNEFRSSCSSVRGQSLQEVGSFDGPRAECNDDRLLQCCLQYSKKDYSVILFTNDKNLCNKAIVTNITVYSHENIVKGLYLAINKLSCKKESPKGKLKTSSLLRANPEMARIVRTSVSSPYVPDEKSAPTVPAKSVSVECSEIWADMETILLRTLSVVLESEMKTAYDNMWQFLIIIKPPWLLLSDVMQCFQKHWIAVFGFLFPRHDIRQVEEMLAMLRSPEAPNLQKINDYITCAMTLLMGIEHYSTYSGLVTDCLKRLASYQEKCTALMDCKRVRFNTINKASAPLATKMPSPPIKKAVSYAPRADTNATLEVSNRTANIRDNVASIAQPPHKKKRPLKDTEPNVYIPSKISTAEIIQPSKRHAANKNSRPLATQNLSAAKKMLPNSDARISNNSERNSSNSDCAYSSLLVPSSRPVQKYEPMLPVDYGFAAPCQKDEVMRLFFGVWDSLNHFSGLLCDTFGVVHKLIYKKPDILPLQDEAQNFLPRIYPVVLRLYRELRMVVSTKPDAKEFRSKCTLLYNSLVNFGSSLDLPDDEFSNESNVTPELICTFCSETANRDQLIDGLKQLNHYRSLLLTCANQASSVPA